MDSNVVSLQTQKKAKKDLFGFWKEKLKIIEGKDFSRSKIFRSDIEKNDYFVIFTQK
jgi:hypothetical protein